MAAPATPELHPNQASDRSLLLSLAWSAGGDWGSQIFAWAAFLAVTRLLAPSDFGMVALVASFQPYLAYLAGFGIPRAVIALRDLTDDQIAQLNTAAPLLGVIGFTLSVLLAHPLALFFRTPGLAPLAIVSCTGLILNGIQSVSSALLSKAFRFRTLSLFNASSALVAAFSTLLLAYLGLGYWSLVLGNLTAGVMRTILVMGTRRQKYVVPRFNSLRRPLVFGSHVFVMLVALNSYQNLDDIMAGRMLGSSALGFYGMAWTLANVPLEKITSLLTTTIPSYLSAVQHDLPAVRRYVRGITGNLALATFPACIGLGIVAPEFVRVFLGRRWEPAIGPLEILSIYAAFRSIVALLPKVLTALGNPRFVMWIELASLVVLGGGFYLGSHWGITGIAWTWVVAYPWVVVPLYWKTFATIEMTVAEYFRALRPALEGTIGMVLSVECARYALSGTHNPIQRLAVQVGAGAVAYIGTLLILHRGRTLASFQLLKNFRNG
jgi:PST family polysaccharide transporter